jgi:hypothetical protein
MSVCALLCIAAPAELCASTDTPSPELTAFAYSRSHPVTPLPPAVIGRFADKGPSDDEARAYAPRPEPVEAGAGQSRAMTRSSVCNVVASVARANDLPVPFFANLIWQESSFDSKTVSRAGAQGIAQFMPKTAAEFGLMNPFEPIEALHAAGRFLSQLRAQFGNLGLAAAAYNAGPGRVIDWMTRRKQLPGETRNYVLRITGKPADRWTAHDVRRDPEARLMPARAPCVEVAEEVAHQVKALRVTRLMVELAAATAPQPSRPRHDTTLQVASVVPMPRGNPLNGEAKTMSKSRLAPGAAAVAHAVAPVAPRPAAKPVAGAIAARATAKPALAKVAAVKPSPREAAAAKHALAKVAAVKPALRKAGAPLVIGAKARKPAAKAALAHARPPAKRTRVASAK